MDQNDFKPLATSVDSQMLDNFLTVILKVQTLLIMSTTWNRVLKIRHTFFSKLHKSSCFDLLENAENSEGIY